MNMKLYSKNRTMSFKSLCTGRKTASCLSLFPKVHSASPQPQGSTPVYLNVYDLNSMNGYVRCPGIGIFHSGIEVCVQASIATTDTSCESVVTSGQHHQQQNPTPQHSQRDANNPAGEERMVTYQT